MLAAASAIIELIFENTVLMLLAIFGNQDPAATATKPAINAYSIRPWPLTFRLGFHPPIASFSNE